MSPGTIEKKIGEMCPKNKVFLFFRHIFYLLLKLVGCFSEAQLCFPFFHKCVLHSLADFFIYLLLPIPQLVFEIIAAAGLQNNLRVTAKVSKLFFQKMKK
jgi:hypothetical protein